jgi:uncharacterized protein
MSSVSRDNPSDELKNEVRNILEMWFLLEHRLDQLSDRDRLRVGLEAAPFGASIRFPGFNGEQEAAHLTHARYLIDECGLFPIFRGRDLDYRLPLFDAYRRMYKAFEPMCAQTALWDTMLGATEIIEILKAIVHPERRPFLLAPSTSTVQ